MNDPIGQAIFDYFNNEEAEDILILTNYTEDEHLSPGYFFRTEEEMPPIEKTALALCKGKVLDVGAAAGCHSLPLQQRGIMVTAVEKSVLAAEVMRQRGIKNVICIDLFNFSGEKFDTILILMNGTGIGETTEGLKKMLIHLKSILADTGQILIDSADIGYLFEEDDGSIWIDLANENYFGEMNYEISYKNISSTFKWLFVDHYKLSKIAKAAGLKCKLVEKGAHHNYLARLTV